MGVNTRSTRRFEHDRVISLNSAHMRFNKFTHFRLQVNKQQLVSELYFPRQWNEKWVEKAKGKRCETECFIHLPLPAQMPREDKTALLSTFKSKGRFEVVAVDAADKRAYNRGRFTVARVANSSIVLRKTFEDLVKPAAKTTESTPAPAPDTALAAAAHAPADPAPVAPVVWHTQVYTRPSLPLLPAADEAACAPVTTAPSAALITRAPAPRTIPRAIPTVYGGIQFRSKLEAKFARLLSVFCVPYLYEPVRVVRAGGTYTPDFFLPAQQLYVELKPKRPHVEEEWRCEEMSRKGFRVVLMYGSDMTKPPFRSELFNGRSHRDYAHHDAVRGMCWIQGRKLVGDTAFVVGVHPMYKSPLDVSDETAVHLNQIQSCEDERWKHEALLDGYRQLIGF
jgi:hypothetical protein